MHVFHNFAIFYAASEFVTYIISVVETLLIFELISAQLKSSRLIFAHSANLDLFQLIQAHIRSCEVISVYVDSLELM